MTAIAALTRVLFVVKHTMPTALFCRHSYLIVLFYNINLGNAHIIRS